MAEETTTEQTQVATQETGAVGTQEADALLASLEKAAPPQFDEELRTKLNSLDPKTLPDDLRKKLLGDDGLRQDDYTRKTQALADQRRELEAKERAWTQAIDKLTAGNITAPPDQVALLKEKVASGDLEAVAELVDTMVAAKTAPVEAQMAKAAAITRAAEMVPFLKDHEAAVAQALVSDPRITAMVKANNYRDADMVIAGLAWQARATTLEAKVQAFEEEKKEFARKAVEAYKVKIGALPAATSRAGSSPTGTTTKDVTSLRDAMSGAWDETFGRTQ